MWYNIPHSSKGGLGNPRAYHYDAQVLRVVFGGGGRRTSENTRPGSGWALGGVIAKTRQERERARQTTPRPLEPKCLCKCTSKRPFTPKTTSHNCLVIKCVQTFLCHFSPRRCVVRACQAMRFACDDKAIVLVRGVAFGDDRRPSRFPSPRSPTTGAPPHRTKMPGRTSQVVPAGPHNPVLDITPGKKQKKLKREPKRESNENRANKTT